MKKTVTALAALMLTIGVSAPAQAQKTPVKVVPGCNLTSMFLSGEDDPAIQLAQATLKQGITMSSFVWNEDKAHKEFVETLKLDRDMASKEVEKAGKRYSRYKRSLEEEAERCERSLAELMK